MPSAELASQANAVAALATATSKRKKEEFATMVTECQGVSRATSAKQFDIFGA
jgi:hypothetical protein